MNKRNTRKSPIKTSHFRVAVFLVLAVALLGGGYYLAHNHPKKVFISSVSSAKNGTAAIKGRTPNPVNYGPSTPTDNVSNNTRKSSPSSAATTLNNGPTKPTPSPVAITIDREGPVTINSATYVQVTTTIGDTTSGSCKMTATQAGQQPITQTQQVQASPGGSYYTCNFSIPESQFPDHGAWSTLVSVTSTAGSASANGSFTL